MKRLLLALLLCASPAWAQFATTTTTAPLGDNTNRISSTAFVGQNALGTTLPSGDLFVGSVGNVATAQSLSGDCSLTNAGAITCTKTNGTLLANPGSAVTDTTNATNISSGTLPAGRMPALTGDVTSSVGTVATTIASAVVTGSKIATNTVTGANLAVSFPPQGRLTISTGVPVMTSTVSAATTVYYTPYHGQFVPLWNGTSLVVTDTGGEISQLTTDTTKSPAAVTTNSNYDVFVWSDSGTIRATRGPPWTSDTARGSGAGTTQLSLQNGILLNTVNITNGPAALRGTYVGTIRSNGTSTIDFILGGSASGGTAGVLGVWNAYNRVNVAASVSDNGASYTYTSATIRQARASAGNQVSFVMGLAEDTFSAAYGTVVLTTAVSGATGSTGVGLDSTSSYTFPNTSVRAPTANLHQMGATNATIFSPVLGRHVLSANESSDGANANTFDEASTNNFSVQLRM